MFKRSHHQRIALVLSALNGLSIRASCDHDDDRHHGGDNAGQAGDGGDEFSLEDGHHL